MAYTAYLNTVQKIYMGYYQRPADPGGLIHWATQLDAVSGNLNQIIATFASSPESVALYGTINSTTISGVVNQIYGALFNRSAEPGGLAYWVGEFNAGRLTAATIMLGILNGAQGADLVSVNNKLDAANLFTNTIDPGLNGPPYEANYSNDLDARDIRLDVIDARTWLSGVTSNVGTIPTQVETTAFIQDHIANLGDPILGTAPVAEPAAANVAEDAAVINGAVSATDVDGGVLTFALNNPAPSGLTFNANGTYSFNPANAAYQSLGVGQSAVLTVPFTVTDNTGLTDTANLVITVTGTNDAPIAAAKVAAGLEDAVNILVTPSSSDVDTGDTATYSVNTQPSNGTVSFNAGTGNFEYIPNANFNGADSFTYKVTDGAGAVSVATVSLAVTAVNDAPVANNAAASGNEDTLIAGAVTASDIENNPLTYSVVTPPTKGAVTLNADGTFIYTPNLNTNGADTFTYRVNDGSANSNTAIVTLTVTPVNDAPVAASSAADTAEDNAVSGNVFATDVDNATLTYSITGAPSNGTVEITNAVTGAYTYTPNPNFNGSDSFIFTASDGTLTSSAAVSINITPVNDAPVANPGDASGFEDLPILGNVVASDVDGDTLNYTVVDQPIDAANPLNPAGTVVMNATTGAFTYTPTPDFNGTATFTYRVNDGTVNSNTATVTLTVTPVDEVLTPGTDTILGNADDEVIVGANHNLNAGDSINGGGGNDTLILSIDSTNTPQTYEGFWMDNVENFIVDNDDTEGVTFDMSSSFNVQTLASTNSSEDVTFNYANTNPGSTYVNLEVINLTKAVDVSLDLRNDDVEGTDDQVNLLVTDSDDASYPDVGNINIMQIGTNPDYSGNESGIEVVNLRTEGSTGNVQIYDLNTPGAWNLNIDTDVTLTIGEESGSLGTVDAPDIERPLNRSVYYVNAGDSTGDIALSTERNDSGATILMGSGDDFIVAGDGSDSIVGGQGNDSIAAGSGNNTIYGGEGNDWIRSGSGSDYIQGGSGNDNINAGDGNNVVYGNEGYDTIVTGSGYDEIYGGGDDDDITFGSSSDYVDAGAGNDTIRAAGNLDSGYYEYYNPWWSWGWGDRIIGGEGNDTLILTSDSGNTHELDGVSGVENILLQGGGSYSISVIDNSYFDTDFETNTTINATAIGGTLYFNGNDGATPGYGSYDDGVLSRAITVLGGSGNDTIITGLGNDSIMGNAGNDSIQSGDGNDTVWIGTGTDNANLGSGDDTLVVQDYDLDVADTITGGAGNDTIQVNNAYVVWGDWVTQATLGAGVTSIEQVVVNPNGGNDVVITFDAGFAQTAITVDAHTLAQSLTVNAQNNLPTENLTIIGGSGGDYFNMGNNLGGDSIDGGPGSDWLQTEGTILDSAFIGVSLVENLALTNGGVADNVTLGANAQAAGIVQVVGTPEADIIDASAYTVGLYVTAGVGDDTIFTGDGDDTIYGGDGSDVINSGAGNDTIYIGNNLPGDFVNAGIGDDTVVVYLNQLGNGVGIWVGNDDTLIGGLGNDTVKLSNASGPVNAGVNLTNVTGFENFTAAYEDWYLAENDVNITFTGGNVATLTTINVSGAALTDGLDDLNVDLSGLGDVDFAFNIFGGAGNDTVTGSNLAENLNFVGGAGDDWMNGPGGDFGTTVSMDGGAGNDTINVTTGKVTDDSFVSISSVEHLTASTALDAQLGAKADAAGIISITGAAGNDTVFVDAAFNNDLAVNLGFSGDGGADSINAGASPSAVTFYGDGNSIDSDDTLVGGSGSGDNLVVTADGWRADLANVSGIETFTVDEDGDNDIEFEFYDGNFTGVAGGVITVDASDLDDTGGDLPEGVLTVTAGGVTAGAFSVIGGTGNDIIVTGSGNDIINAGIGNNSVSAGAGNDSITAGAGNDTIDGGTGNDTINAGDGDNTVTGGIGNDTIITGSGNDTIFAGDGSDNVSSGGGNDQIAGDVVDAAVGGNDTIDAGSGNDIIIGAFGKDSITGGAGTDVFMYTKLTDSSGIMAVNVDEITDFTSGTDIIDFRYVFIGTPMDGATIDFVGNGVNFADAQAGVSPLTADVQAVFQQDEQVLWVDVDNNGVLDGKDLRIKLTGIPTLTGADVLDGQKVGSIVLNSGESFYGTIANDSVTIADQASNVTVDGGAGNDTIMIGDDVGDVTVLGGADDDTIISGNDSADASTDAVPGTVYTAGTTIDGGAGNDTLYLDHGDDISAATVTGIETVVLMHSTVTMTVAQHNSFTNINDGDIGTADTINLVGGGSLTGDPDVETYVLGAADTQIIFNDSNAHTVTGGGANDSITGGSGNDVLTGGGGNDTFVGANAGDSIDGGFNTDTLYLATSYTPAADGSLVDVERVEITGNVAAVNVNLSNQSEGFHITLSDMGDTVSGGALGSNTIVGGTGDDSITGGGVADTISGGGGNDTIIGGAGIDSLLGANGSDIFVGADDGDTIDGGNNNDTLRLAADYTPTANGNLVDVENVTVTGNVAAVNVDLSGQSEGFNITLSNLGDTASGGALSNTITGGTGADSITGGAAADTLDGGAGNDTIIGLGGADIITGGLGDDSLLGGGGNDTFVGADNNDIIDGEGDTDTLQLLANYIPTADGNLVGVENITVTGNVAPVNVDLSGQSEGFNIILSNLGDTVAGGAASNTITGGTGADSITGAGFGIADTLSGGAGNDTINGDGGDDLITGGLGNDSLFGGNGIDTFVGADNNDTIDGGNNNDTLQLSADYTPAGPGNLENVEDVTVTGNVAAVNVNLSNQLEGFNITLSNMGDTVSGGAGSNTIIGGTGADSITGGASADTISGGPGDDIIVGFTGTDFVNGNAGTNTLKMSAGSLDLDVAANGDLVNIDTVDFSSAVAAVTVDLTNQLEAINIIGSANVDTVTAATGGGSITGSLGADIITLGAGVDTLAYTAIDESRGVNVDQVTGFTSLTDKININPITGGSGVFLGNCVDNVSAQMALTGTPGDAVYSIAAATLYVDVNGDALLNNADLAIHLIGVVALDVGGADIIF